MQFGERNLTNPYHLKVIMLTWVTWRILSSAPVGSDFLLVSELCKRWKEWQTRSKKVNNSNYTTLRKSLLEAANIRFVIVISFTKVPRRNSIIQPINSITFINLINSDGINQCVVTIWAWRIKIKLTSVQFPPASSHAGLVPIFSSCQGGWCTNWIQCLFVSFQIPIHLERD